MDISDLLAWVHTFVDKHPDRGLCFYLRSNKYDIETAVSCGALKIAQNSQQSLQQKTNAHHSLRTYFCGDSWGFFLQKEHFQVLHLHCRQTEQFDIHFYVRAKFRIYTCSYLIVGCFMTLRPELSIQPHMDST